MSKFGLMDGNPDYERLEERILNFWEKHKIFEKSLKATAKGEPFTFYDGPPFATGLPHYGHILASTVKDLFPRYQTMKGRFVRRRWGWDCHGLPIEEIVERKLGISGKKDIEEKIGIKRFNETCRQTVLQYVEEWGKTVRKIARWVDFDNSYKTMDATYMESVWRAFKQIYDKGLIYEGRKVLLYCSRCETPVSNFEVAMDNSYKDVEEEATIVKFKAKSEKLKVKEPIFLLSWTTTPWTLPGNVALAVGRDIEYSVVRLGGANYILATKTVPEVLKFQTNLKFQILNYKLKGQDLVGLKYQPLFEVPEIAASPRSYEVYEANFVNTDEGTGIVHTAVVYGEEDYELGLKEDLPVVPLLDEKGRFNDRAPKFLRGKYFKDAEEAVKADLEKRGLLFEKALHRHSYPHCWRCETPLFYNAIPAWFVNVGKIKKKILQSNRREINWYPEHLKFGRYQNSVKDAPDWNISRNRYWGNPIPVWKCEECGKNTVVGSVEELKGKMDINFQPASPAGGFTIFNLQKDSGFDLHRPGIDEVVLRCQECGGKARRITEIFDSWFEAASMPFAEYHYPFENKAAFEARFPAQFVAEYIAQTRAWFYVMHVVSLILFGKAPFENVVTTGTILAEDGSKMSKSKNNFPDPWLVLKKYGTDSLRFYLMGASVMQADNLNFSERDLEIVNRKVLRILRNVAVYWGTYIGNSKLKTQNSKLNTKNAKPGTRILDQWVKAQTQQLINTVTEHLDNYDTVRACREIEAFINDLSTWYVRRSRGREDREFGETFTEVLMKLCQVIAPVMPYAAEEIFQSVSFPDRRGEIQSVHLTSWPKAKKLSVAEKNLLQHMQAVRELAEAAHALRAKAGVKLRQPLGKLKVKSGQWKVLGHEFLEILKDEINVKEVSLGNRLELDTILTPELRLEGAERELSRQINEFRKSAGLRIGELADLAYWTESAMLKAAADRIDRNKIYAKNLQFTLLTEGRELVVDGEKIRIAIVNSK